MANAPWRRRALLAGGTVLVAGWIIGLPRLLVGGSAKLAFKDLPDLPPFRMLEASGTVSTSGGALAGLGTEAQVSASDQELQAEVRANPCAALFGDTSDPRLPVAFFSDFNCPNCRVLNADILAYDAKHPGTLRIVRHELPLLGAPSTLASKAVLAADLQGGYQLLHDRLMRARLVTDKDYILAIAASVGLDGPRLVQDMQSPAIQTKLDRSRAIAALFGFYGTPSTVIGRTAFVGAIPGDTLAQIIDDELAAPTPACRSG